MPPLIAIATEAQLPDLDPDSQLLLEPLAAAGVEATVRVWSDPAVEWSAFDLVVIRSTWDYFDRFDEFIAWIDRVEPLVPMVNPAHILRWNAHKTYLRDLGERGVPVVDTVWLPAGETVAVPFEQAVVKPAVSGNALGLTTAVRGERVTAERDLMIQPLLGSIRTEGELSLFYADGALVHTVRKTPKPGDIRSQPQYGSDVRLEDPPDEAEEAAERVLESVGETLAYARVDLVRADDGTLRLIELEVIEPNLYLRYDPPAAERFASAIARRAAVPRG